MDHDKYTWLNDTMFLLGKDMVGVDGKININLGWHKKVAIYSGGKRYFTRLAQKNRSKEM